jgi:cell shape-determining protein MreC
MASYTDPPEEGRGRRDLFTGGFFLFLGALAFFLPSDSQGRIAQALRGSVLRPFTLTQETVAQARLRAEGALSLQAKLDSLGALVASQAALEEENRHLRELLDIEAKAPRTFVHANLLRSGTAGSQSLFLLDVGSDQGVRPGDPVLMRGGTIGLVGRILDVTRKGAVGLDWSHPDFRASAMTADGRVPGLVEPRPGAFSGGDRLLLTAVPYNERMAPGTLITTSGIGGVYPRGIPIGEVVELHRDEGQWLSEYWLRPVVHPASVTHVLVAKADSVTMALLEALDASGAEVPLDSGALMPASGPEASPNSASGGGS